MMNLQDQKQLTKNIMRVINREIEQEFYSRDWSKANVCTDANCPVNKDTIMASTLIIITKGECYDVVSAKVKMGITDKQQLLEAARKRYLDTFNYYNYRWMIAKRAIAFYKKHEEVFKDSSNVTIDDLIAEGMAKLIEITEKFDESKGYRFNTFLMTCLDNEFMEYSVRHSRFIRLTKKQNRTIAEVSRRFDELKETDLTSDEIIKTICKEFGKSEYEIDRMLSMNKLPASLDFGFDSVDGAESYIGYTLPEDIDGPLEKRVADAIKNACDTPKKDIEIYLKAFGYNGKPALKKDLIEEYGFKNRNELNTVLENTRCSLGRELRPLFSDYLS